MSKKRNKKLIPSTKFPKDALQTLAGYIRVSRAKNGGKANRSEVIGRFNRKFKKRRFRLTNGKLAALYRPFGDDPRSGLQDDFLKAFPPVVRKKKVPLAKSEVAPQAVTPVAERPPNAVPLRPEPEAAPVTGAEAIKEKTMTVPKPQPKRPQTRAERPAESLPIAAKPDITVSPQPVAEELSQEEPPEPEASAVPVLEPRRAAIEREVEPSRSLKAPTDQKDLDETIAALLDDWRPSMTFKPYAYVAMHINQGRVTRQERTISAAEVENRIDKYNGLRSFMANFPRFKGRITEIADEILDRAQA